MWAVEHWGVEPDILLVAKGIASGMPLGAMVAPGGDHGVVVRSARTARRTAATRSPAPRRWRRSSCSRAGSSTNAAARGEQAMAGLRELLDAPPEDRPRRPRQGPDDRRRVRRRRSSPKRSSGRASSAACSSSSAASRPSGSARRSSPPTADVDTARPDLRRGGRGGRGAPIRGRARGRGGRRPARRRGRRLAPPRSEARLPDTAADERHRRSRRCATPSPSSSATATPSRSRASRTSSRSPRATRSSASGSAT